MTACPNCGRQTLRTKDWACQWCGYPLISRAFKLIDKTFKELQEERSMAPVSSDSDTDDDFEYEPEQEPEEESEPEPEEKPQPAQKPKFKFFRKPQPTPPRPAIEPEPAPRYEPPVRRSVQPVNQPETAPPPPVQRPVVPEKPVYRQEPPRQEPPRQVMPPETVQKPAPPPVPARQPEPESRPAAAVPPAPAPEPPPAPKSEIIVEPPSPPVSAVKLENIRDGMEISADDLDALFRLDKSGTNIKLNGKTIVLKGVVEKVFVREHLEIRYIVVKGTKRSVWSARCTFDKDAAVKAARLNEGDEVAVRSKYDGYGKNIIFKDCEVV